MKRRRHNRRERNRMTVKTYHQGSREKSCKSHNIKGLLLLGILLWVAGPKTVFSKESAATVVREATLSLEELVAEAMEKNPEISSLRELEAAQRAVVPQAHSLPDPVVTMALRNVGLDRVTVGEEMMAGRLLSVSQKIPFPGKLGRTRDVAKWEVAASSYTTQEKSLDLVAGVKTTYYDLYYAYEAIDILTDIENSLTTILETSEARYSAGEAQQQDVLKAQVELSRLAERKILLEERKAILKDRLNRMLGRAPGGSLGRPGEIRMTTIESTAPQLNTLAEEKAPLLQVKRSLTRKEESSLNLAKKQYLPDIYLGMTWMDRGVLEDVWEARVGFELPIYFWTKEKKGVEEAQYRYGMAKYDTENTRLELLQKIQDRYVELQTSERLYDLYVSTIIPQTRLALESSRRGYETGKLDFLTLYENLITLLDYRLDATVQLVRHESSLAELESIVGETLSRSSQEE